MDMTAIEGPGPLLEGRVAVITGGGGGIGAAAALLFARHGAHVVVAEIDANRAGETARSRACWPVSSRVAGFGKGVMSIPQPWRSGCQAA